MEHKEFKILIQILRSGYLPPNRHRLLDEVHNNVIYECKEMFKDQIVSMVYYQYSKYRLECVKFDFKERKKI